MNNHEFKYLVAAAQLNEFFEQTPDPAVSNPYYSHNNEVVHLAPFLFNRMGAPWLNRKSVRFICEKAHADGPDGLAGDDDVGADVCMVRSCRERLSSSLPGRYPARNFQPRF